LIKHFSELPLSAYTQERLAAAEFSIPTTVQASAIPHGLAGTDILATAQTGTGKTLAFLVPVIERLLTDKPAGVSALVLVPTRELAIQVVTQYDQLRGKKLPAAAQVVGGLSEREQIKSIKAGARLVVATPGRLEDLISRRLIDLSTLKILVLDEADRMLDMGFIQPIRRIVAKLPKDRQTMLFSATLETSVVHLVGDYLRNPVRLAFGSTLKPGEQIKLQAYEVSAEQKLALLRRLLENETGRCLVFTRTKRGTERLAKKLVHEGISAAMIHGGRTQPQRNAALADFQKGKVRLLIATDVASRGIHVDDIAHVINYELPEVAEDFVHRVGRTGRAGANGLASTFFSRQEMHDLATLERTLKIRMERMKVEGTLAREERPKPVDVSNYVPKPVGKGSRMVRMPGEVLQRHGASS
jgi:ATP-dependent RNA helicase RhlE